MSAGAVRAGKAFIEISANDTEFQKKLKQTHNSIVGLRKTLVATGSAMASAGAAIGLPMVLAARTAATFQDALLELKGAVADISPEQLEAVRAEALRLSKSLGISPTRIAQAFTLLIKAGMTVEDALAGAGKSAIEFAQVSGVEASQAAEFMKVSMNVFGLSAKEAADTLSAAADSSETSIASMIESFALVASVAKGTNQSLFGLSQGLAVLARYGIKGEEAGTGIKTLLVKLLAPTDDAKEALAQLGMSMESLVDDNGKLLPLAQIAEKFSVAMKGMDKSAREAMLTNEALVKVFDVRGIRVIHAFGEEGKAGFDKIATSMESSRSVSQKFALAMSELTGVGHSLMAVVERLAIAFSDGGLTGAVRTASTAIIRLIDGVSWLLTSVPVLSPILAGVTSAVFAVGASLLFAGAALGVVNFAMARFIAIGPVVATVIAGISAAIAGLTAVLAAVGAALAALTPFGWLILGLSGLIGAGTGVQLYRLVSGAAAGGSGPMPGNGSDDKDEADSGIKRDEDRRPLAQPARPRNAEPEFGRGESSGTFGKTSQIGIANSLTSAEETARNTERTADGVEELARNNRDVPPAQALQAGIKNDSPAVAGRVAARSDRELLSASERTAMASEKTAEVLMQMLMNRKGGLQFS
jgi:TP901 family phage tail tape measure protein